MYSEVTIAGTTPSGLPSPIIVDCSVIILNQELSRSLGGIGEFNKRQIWYRLGRFPRMAIFKFIMSDPVKPVFIKLEASVRTSNRGR